MAKFNYVAKEGFEEVFNIVLAKQNNLDSEIQAEVDKAVAEINESFKVRAENIARILEQCADLVEVVEEIQAEEIVEPQAEEFPQE